MRGGTDLRKCFSRVRLRLITSTGEKTCGPTTTNLNTTEVHCRHLPGIGGSLGFGLTFGWWLPELEYFQKMLVQTLSITTPPIVQDFDWPALVQQVQREKGSEQVSIIDVGGGICVTLFNAFMAWCSPP